MSKPIRWQRIGLAAVVFAALLSWPLGSWIKAREGCDARGGVVVMGVFSFQCVAEP